MLNSSANVNVSNHVNAISGTIIKTYKQSYFKRFHLNSPLADKLFAEKSDTVVVQMMMCGDMDVIAELINRNIYDELLRGDNNV